MNLQLIGSLHRPVLPADRFAGRPAHQIFRLSPGFSFEFPRRRSLSSEPASAASGCPLASAIRLCRRSRFELPQTLMPLALPVSARFGVAPVALARPAAPVM
jgi:hypothetical protein